MQRPLPLFVSVLTVTLLAACGGAPAPAAQTSPTPLTTPTQPPPTSASPTDPGRVEGTVVRFTGAGTSVDVTIDADGEVTIEIVDS